MCAVFFPQPEIVQAYVAIPGKLVISSMLFLLLLLFLFFSVSFSVHNNGPKRFEFEFLCCLS